MFNRPPDFENILLQVFGKNIPLKNCRLIAAGNLNQAIFLESEEDCYFLKTNHEHSESIFKMEDQSLELLRKNTFLHIPRTYGFGKTEDVNFLLMEWIPEGKANPSYWEELGQGLAQLHMATANRFGLEEDNFISVLPQVNREQNNWPDFFVQNRLENMLARAYYHGNIGKDFLEKFRGIYPLIRSIFPDEKPALLHGDLWSGNIMVNGKGNPALIDPAVYFGHREMDLAFSRLFGGFSGRFYAAYNEAFPLEPDFEERMEIYNLYPLLVHLNLFGKSYLSGIERIVEKYVGK